MKTRLDSTGKGGHKTRINELMDYHRLDSLTLATLVAKLETRNSHLTKVLYWMDIKNVFLTKNKKEYFKTTVRQNEFDADRQGLIEVYWDQSERDTMRLDRYHHYILGKEIIYKPQTIILDKKNNFNAELETYFPKAVGAPKLNAPGTLAWENW